MKISHMTRKVQQLIRDAEYKDFKIECWDASGPMVSVCKYSRGVLTRGVKMFLTEAGGFDSSIRLDIHPSLASSIRTLKLTRQVLGL